ncbi:hypothetical protein F4778DRAFT_712318 [Xylariomycetidae sp. FL2044]|nr:hypothetical protein F4778DRAFT_712318 [Xylariomycetidae sp. FL2044]
MMNFAVLIIALAGRVRAEYKSHCDQPMYSEWPLDDYNHLYVSSSCLNGTEDIEDNKWCVMCDLTTCFANNDGHLVPNRNGRFDRSCHDCSLTGHNNTVLSCTCKKFGSNGAMVRAEVDTNELLRFENGFINCWGQGSRTCPGERPPGTTWDDWYRERGW